MTSFDLIPHLLRQRQWSEQTFGPGPRTAGLLDHIRKELREIEATPFDGEEWIDVVILALDGAWRAGLSPEQIIETLAGKQAKNEARTWPDWRTADPSKAIEHIRIQPQAEVQEAGLDAGREQGRRNEHAHQPPSAPVGVDGLMQLARNWCLAWGEWAHDADPGCAKENAAEAALRAAKRHRLDGTVSRVLRPEGETDAIRSDEV